MSPPTQKIMDEKLIVSERLVSTTNQTSIFSLMTNSDGLIAFSYFPTSMYLDISLLVTKITMMLL